MLEAVELVQVVTKSSSLASINYRKALLFLRANSISITEKKLFP
jgi:hypothetical protein